MDKLLKDVLMIDELSIVEIDKVNHTVEMDMLKLVVEVECFGKCVDEFDNGDCLLLVWRPLEMILIALMVTNQLEWLLQGVSSNIIPLSLVTPSTVIDGQTSGPFSMEARIILPCDYMVLHNSGEKLYVSIVTSHIKQMAASIEVSQGSLFLEELNKKWMEHEKAFDMLGVTLWVDNIINYDKIEMKLKAGLVETV
ncbi:hypothetical protein Tco_1256333 [Tanacetum coccineum]